MDNQIYRIDNMNNKVLKNNNSPPSINSPSPRSPLVGCDIPERIFFVRIMDSPL